MGKTKEKMYIEKMIGATITAFVVFAFIGAMLCIWFSNEARPAVRYLRDASMYTTKFAMFFYGGSVFTLAYSLLMEYLGGIGKADEKKHWYINTAVTTLVAIAVAVIFYIYAPTKDTSVSVVASAVIFLQGFLIYFIGSLFAPPHWGVYNPAAK